MNSTRLAVERLENRRLLAVGVGLAADALVDPPLPAREISLVRHFDTWDGGVIASTDVAGITYHPPSGNLYLVDGEINELPAVFNGDNIFEVSLAGDRVFREITSNNPEPTGITYNEFDGFFYVTNDNWGGLERYDDNLDTSLAAVRLRNDVFNARDPEGVTSDPANGMLYVVDGGDGGSQVLVYDSNLVYQSRFSFASKTRDAEGIAFDTETSHLFIVAGFRKKIYEYTVSGDFVAQYDISTFSPVPQAAQGLTFAPTSDPNDDPAARSLYIADGMRDNFEDGRIFEVRFIPRGEQDTSLFAGQNTISNPEGADGAFGVFAADVDGDGDIDVLSASFHDNTIVWFENDGRGGFTDHLIDSAVRQAISVFAADIDGDGDTDVLSASFKDDEITWYENDGSEGFTAHTISTAARGATSVIAVDLDGDGDVDVLSASYRDDKIAWYENDGSEGFREHIITSDADGAFDVFAKDLNGDGLVDVLSASRNDDTIAWYENDGSGGFTEHIITSDADGAVSVHAVDIDGDGDVDVISASRNDDTIAWYENDGSGAFEAHTVSTAAQGANRVYAADLDGDGDHDLLSASFSDDKIAWYENDGSGAFTVHAITTAADGAIGVFAADLDGDWDLDVLSASFLDDRITWYESLAFPDALPGPLYTPVDPLGSLASEASVAASIDEAGGRKTLRVSLVEGQNMALVMRSPGELKGSITVEDPTGAILAQATSSIAGQSVVVPRIAATVAGLYTVALSGADGTTGDFTLHLILNATVELEAEGGPANDQAVTAANLDTHFLSLGAGRAERAVVIGTLQTADEDWYRFRLDDGQSVTLVLAADATSAATLDLYDATLQHLATGIAGSNAGSSIRGFVDRSTDGGGDDYFVRVTGNAADYSLLLTRDLQFDVEPNDHPGAGVQDVTLTGLALGAVDGAVAPAFMTGGVPPDMGEIPPPAPLEDPLVFGVIGDYGRGWQPEADVAEMIKGWGSQFIVTVGDNNYGNVGIGEEDGWEERVGRYYGDYILGRSDNRYPNQTSPTQRFFPTVGNHDDDNFNQTLDGFVDYFVTDPAGDRLPANGGGREGFSTNYAFQQGNAEFFIIDSLFHDNTHSQQMAWLRQGLAESTAQWKFVFMHYPGYSSGKHGGISYMKWPFKEWGADAVLAGHDHDYERLEVDGLPYFVNGVGGFTVRDFETPIPESLVRYNDEFGAMRVTIEGLVARFDFLSIDDGASGANGGKLIDSLVIDKRQLDRYDVQVNAGDDLLVEVTARQWRSAGAVNLLDPTLELFDPRGNRVATDHDGGAGLNARLLHSATTTGTYSIVVGAALHTAGEYLLRVEGQTGDAAPFAVRSSQPRGSEPLDEPPRTITVDFDNLVRLDTLQADDLTVDGVPASSVTVLDGDTAVFELPSRPGNGVHEVRIEPGRILDVQGVPIDLYVSSFSVDAVSPRVTLLQVGGTLWSSSFVEQLPSGRGVDEGPAQRFYGVPVGDNEQLELLPWSTIDMIRIVLSEDVDVGFDDLVLAGTNVPDYPIRQFSYDVETATATWTLRAPLRSDKLLIQLSGRVHDAAGNTLDGDWTNAADTFPSGNGVVTSNENFRFRLNVLVGDVDANGRVTRRDVVETLFAQGAEAGDARYRARYDVDADGHLGLTDLRAVLARLGTRSPSGQPAAPTSGSIARPAADAVFERLGGGASPAPRAAEASLLDVFDDQPRRRRDAATRRVFDRRTARPITAAETEVRRSIHGRRTTDRTTIEPVVDGDPLEFLPEGERL